MNSIENRRETFPVIETAELTKKYGTATVLDRLNIRVEKGSITGFLGPNGAGKSTTIMVLLGLIRADSGTLRLLGNGEADGGVGAEGTALRGRIGYLSQTPRFHPWMTAHDVLSFTARFFYRRVTRELNEWIGDSLEMAGLYEKARRPVGQFSGGELQRLGLAQAWINRPELLILDEPAASLDPAGRYDVLALMERLRDHSTIFYSTHILEDVERIADSVIILNEGRAVYQGATAGLLAGSGGTILVKVRERDAGASLRLQTRLEGEAWLESLIPLEHREERGWTVTIRHRDEGERRLLEALVREPGLELYHFEEKKQRLEEIFLELTKKGDCRE
jgi:ABC-2 type transport system ATP-binding protein